MNVREVRILIGWRNSIYKLCKVAFSAKDASLYLFPYAKDGAYNIGSKVFPKDSASLTFNFAEDASADVIPKLSIHESGQVHVSANGKRIGPLFIPPLETLTGQHIATVCPNSFECLPAFLGIPKSSGQQVDCLLPADDIVLSGRLAIYANCTESKFNCQRKGVTIELQRPSIQNKLYLRLAPIAQLPLSKKDEGGVTIISGWNPNNKSLEEDNFLYITGV